jgi:hypothetical protein
MFCACFGSVEASKMTNTNPRESRAHANHDSRCRLTGSGKKQTANAATEDDSRAEKPGDDATAVAPIEN